MTKTKMVKGFVWLIVTDKAYSIYGSGAFDLYELHGDGSESLITSARHLVDAVDGGNDIGIEVCHLEDLLKQLVS